MQSSSDRRAFLHRAATLASASAGAASLAGGASFFYPSTAASQTVPTMSTVKPRYCLNMSTIHGEVIDIVDQVKIASEAGYDGVELWLRDIQNYTKSGGDLVELRKRIADAGLLVESAIAFGQWIAEDPAARKKGLEQCAQDMDVVRRLGGQRIAAPPAGAITGDRLNLDAVTERYRALCELGRQYDVVPQLEVWGFSKNLSKLCDVLYVTAACEHPNACVLPDVYHLFKGGSHFVDLQMLAGARVHVFHMNDYPAQPTRETITDADRVYPTDGIAPIRHVLRTVIESGFQGALSLELFNRGYWQQDPREVAKTGLAKMKSAVALLGT
jgi:sugar phosphate isomerase/epimerase